MTQRTHIAKQEEAVTENAVQVRATDPGSPVTNQLWANTTGKLLKYYDGASIQTIGGGGGGGGTANNIDLMIDKAQKEHVGLFANPLTQGVFSSFQSPRFKSFAQLIEAYTASTTVMRVVFNVVHLDSTDQDTDSAANWSVGGDAVSVTTSATAKIAALSLSFTTGATQTTSYIKIAPTQLSVPQNTNLYFWVNIPSLTNLAAIRIQVAQEAGLSNVAIFDLTLNEAGGALTTGWNFMHVNVAGTPTSTLGTGWLPSMPIGGFAAGVTKTLATTVFTGVLLDAFAFADSTGQYAAIGDEFTINDVTNRENVIIDSTSTNFQGTIVLGAALANSYVGILDGSGPVIQRTTMYELGDGKAAPYTGAAGGIVQTQEVRMKKYLSSGLTGATVTAAIAFDDPKILRVVNISGSNVILDDPGDHHLLFVSGNTVRSIAVLDNDGVEQYKPRSVNPSLTGNATFGGGQTTLPLSSAASIAIGDIIVKDQIVPSVSCVTTSPAVNENFSAMSFQKLEVVNDAIPAPQVYALQGHWPIGGFGTTGSVNLLGPKPSLTIHGSIPTTNPFFKRQLSAGPFTSVNFYDLSVSDSASFISDTAGNNASYSQWIYFQTLPVAGLPSVWSHVNGSNGIILVFNPGTNKMQLYFNGGSPVSHPTVLSAATWYNVQVILGGATTTGTIIINGVSFTFTQPATSQSGANFNMGVGRGGGSDFNGYVADLVIWNAALTQASSTSIYNGGQFRPIGSKDSFFTYWTAAGLTGDKLSFKAAMSRTTDADRLYYTIAGATV